MAKQPEFTHIHCSSRFDRSAESLETALDSWMDDSSLITLTEVANANRASQLREKGWDYWNATQKGGRADDAAICWKKNTWRIKHRYLRKLYGSFQSTNQRLSGLWATSVLLKRADTGQTLLVTVSHLPHDSHLRDDVQQAWRERKAAYQGGMKAWSNHVTDLNRKTKPDALIVCGDFNMSLKTDWFRAYMRDHWKGLNLHLAWKDFPTAGGTGPGAGIIDGSYYHGMVTDGAELMARTASSDHRPYKERFTMGKSEKDDPKQTTTVTGHTYKGKEWWGFGDYGDDELYDLARASGEEEGEVL